MDGRFGGRLTEPPHEQHCRVGQGGLPQQAIVMRRSPFATTPQACIANYPASFSMRLLRLPSTFRCSLSLVCRSCRALVGDYSTLLITSLRVDVYLAVAAAVLQKTPSCNSDIHRHYSLPEFGCRKWIRSSQISGLFHLGHDMCFCNTMNAHDS